METKIVASSGRGPLPVPPQPAVLSSQALLGSGNVLLIEHQGALYTLRVTRNGKLILTK